VISTISLIVYDIVHDYNIRSLDQSSLSAQSPKDAADFLALVISPTVIHAAMDQQSQFGSAAESLVGQDDSTWLQAIGKYMEQSFLDLAGVFYAGFANSLLRVGP
jgi:hypothetical protein